MVALASPLRLLSRPPERLRPYFVAAVAALAMFQCAPAAFPAEGETSQPAQKDGVAFAGGLSAEQVAFFEKKVRPVFANHCYECHSAEAKEIKGGLRLDSKPGWEKGGDSGPAIVPGDPDSSLVIRAVRYLDKKLQMPPNQDVRQPLTPSQIADLATWVQMGAPDPRLTAAVPGSDVKKPAIDWAEARKFWSYQPVRDARVPPTGNSSWCYTACDSFILSKLEANGLAPNADADKRTLLRRVTYDVTGLPPTVQEIDAFLADTSPLAFQRVVDRLLASPAYGERWGQHWLDLARYADTSGCNADVPIPDAWKYRNYVIDSLNRDKPYDQFLREQLAGDLLPANSDRQRFENIIATGYLAISRRFSSLPEEPHLTIEDTIDNVSKTMLGLSLSCARCHDHKFDPLPNEDYYALYGIFESTRYAFPGTEIPRHPRDLVALVPPDRYDRDIKSFEEKMKAIDKEMDDHYAVKVSLDTGKEREAADAAWKKCTAERDALMKTAPSYEKAYAVGEGRPANTRVQLKGDPKKLGVEVPRGFLQVLGGQQVPAGEKGSGRRELADWITNRNNPLTARVIVNRLWQHHFGEGLVRTPNDFGARGQAPTHPELLDYLATRLVENGWSLKSMHKLMLLSHAYQISTATTDSASLKDPDNKLLWRFNRRRLSAEEIRDSMLAVSGALDFSPGGAHPFKPQWEWRYTQHLPFVDDFPSDHRSIYLLHQRIRQQPVLGVFDGADPNMATGQRPLSITAIQALFMMNDPLAHTQADLFAKCVLASKRNTSHRISLAYQLAFARTAIPAELLEGHEYLEEVTDRLKAAKTPEEKLQRAAWASYLRVLFSSNEFLFLD